MSPTKHILLNVLAGILALLWAAQIFIFAFLDNPKGMSVGFKVALWLLGINFIAFYILLVISIIFSWSKSPRWSYIPLIHFFFTLVIFSVIWLASDIKFKQAKNTAEQKNEALFSQQTRKDFICPDGSFINVMQIANDLNNQAYLSYWTTTKGELTIGFIKTDGSLNMTVSKPKYKDWNEWESLLKTCKNQNNITLWDTYKVKTSE